LKNEVAGKTVLFKVAQSCMKNAIAQIYLKIAVAQSCLKIQLLKVA
jgi:hypothetical protein